jgi:predicted ATP-grasp superfamily ATP-dependent carboligase
VTAIRRIDNLDDGESPVLILGASTRAAAHSAIRAGLTPLCGDLFADLDLRECAGVLECRDYPRGLISAAAAFPHIPWMYTGGLENHLALVRTISQSHPLWGNDAGVLARIRNPWRITDMLNSARLPALRVWPKDENPPAADGTWIRKPLRGAAGRGIGIWDHLLQSHKPQRPAKRDACYFQERRKGTPISALFLALPGQTLLLAITRQLVGLAAVHAPPFAWCGTIAPAAVSRETRTAIETIAATLSPWAGLRGLFGCDFLVDEHDGAPWLTEVNPRYPASTEIVEHVLGVPLLDSHRRACDSFAAPSATPPLEVPPLIVPPSGGHTFAPPSSTTPHVIGKIIFYAQSHLTAPDLSRFVLRPRRWHAEPEPTADALPYLADIPVPGTHIAADQPVCTLFARAPNDDECLTKLLHRASRLESRLR